MHVFSALQLKEGETAHQAVKAFMDVAVAKGLEFKVFELLGVIQLGRYKFIRFRTNCKEPQAVLEELFKDGRGIVFLNQGIYSLRFPNGKLSTLTSVTMQSVGEPGIRRLYRGPSAEFWERQFE